MPPRTTMSKHGPNTDGNCWHKYKLRPTPSPNAVTEPGDRADATARSSPRAFRGSHCAVPLALTRSSALRPRTSSPPTASANRIRASSFAVVMFPCGPKARATAGSAGSGLAPSPAHSRLSALVPPTRSTIGERCLTRSARTPEVSAVSGQGHLQ